MGYVGTGRVWSSRDRVLGLQARKTLSCRALEYKSLCETPEHMVFGV